jgi:biofilm PGA synthesis N-glycosyltransferase PgaC
MRHNPGKAERESKDIISSTLSVPVVDITEFSERVEEQEEVMLLAFILWVVSAFFSLGVLGLSYIWTRHTARKPWKIRTTKEYSPKVSIIVPTHNEGEVIGYKLKNLAKLDYPKSSTHMIFIDSGSTDSTLEKVRTFAKDHQEMNISVLVENERRGKSSALNTSLKSCDGDVVIVSDADCLWPSNILTKALPYLADPDVGAISGPKKLLNREASLATKNEDTYLESMNMIKLGESKSSSTILFEGGFSAYKKEVLESFDPYVTGSDDCGTVIRLLEKGLKAIMVQEAEFFTTFPKTWRGRIAMKIRRANQLLRILKKYAVLLFKNKIRIGQGVAAKNVFLYLVSPFMFLLFLVTTAYVMVKLPWVAASLLIFVIPKVRNYIIELALNYLILLYATFSSMSRKKFVIWEKPDDRGLLEEKTLVQKGLI